MTSEIENGLSIKGISEKISNDIRSEYKIKVRRKDFFSIRK